MRPALRALPLVAMALLMPVAVASAQPAPAQSKAPAATAKRTPLPTVARGKGDTCVAPVDWMRRNHMTALTHKRDETVYQGDRTPRFSLNACISCHVVTGKDGAPVTFADPKHFCRSCHDYAAVKVDCFECHASRPEPGKAAANPHRIGPEAGDVAALQRYLAEVAR